MKIFKLNKNRFEEQLFLTCNMSQNRPKIYFKFWWLAEKYFVKKFGLKFPILNDVTSISTVVNHRTTFFFLFFLKKTDYFS